MTTRIPPSSLLGLLFAAALTSLTLNPAASAATSVSQHGITWTFDRDYPTGQFANGDHWVVGPVTLTSITPLSTTSSGVTMHGSMINPRPNSAQGFDSRIKSNTFDATRNVARAFPLHVPAGSSLVSSVSNTLLASGNNPQLHTIAVLTVLASAPPAGSFRPPYAGTDKTIRWNKSRLDYSKLRSLPLVSSSPTLSTLEALFAKPFIDLKTNWTSTYLQPETNHPSYGREISHQVGVAMLALQLNYTNAQKERLLIGLVQRGLDVYGLALNGGNWGNDAGHRHGRKPMLLLAGAVLSDSAILAYADAKQKFIFQEDQQMFYVTMEDVLRPRKTSDGRYRAPYTTSMIGMPEWGGKHIGEPEGDASNWDCHYRTVCGASTVGTVLAARLMGLESRWNWPPLFDYIDRYWKIESPSTSTGTNSIHPFVKSMWDAYRGATSTTFTVTNTTTAGIWQSVPFPSQTGTFTCSFDMVPSQTPMDGVTGLSSGAPSQLSQLMAAVRFSPAGTIDALNGSTYSASTSLRYAAGVKYRVVMTVDFPRKTYSVNVTPAGGSQVTIAQNWAFRSTSVTKLDYIGFVASDGSHAVTSIGVQTTTTTSTEGSITTSGDALVRVNAGGGEYYDPNGKRWLADTGFNGGTTYTNSNTISGTTMQTLYRSERYMSSTTNLAYNFTVPNGDYVVKLHFAETWSTAFVNGARVFSVMTEGKTVLSNLDIFARVGANQALVLSVPARVADGKLTIEFVRNVQNPKICAIEVFQAASTLDGQTTTTTSTEGSTTTSGDALVRVNAGGSEYYDPNGKRWLADTGFNGGTTYTNSNTISGTTMQTLYHSERYMNSTTNLAYNFAVPNGDYVVKLHLAETWSAAFATGARVFSVMTEGKTVLSNLDIFARVGANKALVLSVPARVADGKLTIEFVRNIQNPKICAIEVFKAQ
jgi:hypothetical protein